MFVLGIFLFYGVIGILGFEPKDENYCEEELCNIYNGTNFVIYPHIGCNNKGNIQPTCPEGAKMLKMVERRRNVILSMHNELRNKVALGKLEEYSSAAAMPVLKWDDELEYLAGLHVKRCLFAHDFCRNTDRFPNSGQNIAFSWQIPAFHSNTKRIKMGITLWTKEHIYANMTFIDAYQPHPDSKKANGHFVMMVADQAKRIGCAAIRYPYKEEGRAFLMTCNYDSVPIFTQPIYVSGKPASKCQIKHQKYHGLCDWEETETDNIEDNELSSNFVN